MEEIKIPTKIWLFLHSNPNQYWKQIIKNHLWKMIKILWIYIHKLPWLFLVWAIWTKSKKSEITFWKNWSQISHFTLTWQISWKLYWKVCNIVVSFEISAICFLKLGIPLNCNMCLLFAIAVTILSDSQNLHM